MPSPWLRLFLALVAWASAAAAQLPAAERATLVKLYQSTYKNTQRDRWTRSANWLTGDPCTNNWQGVYCEGCPSYCAVSKVHLRNNKLRGTVPPLGALTKLRELDLRDNGALTGTFPEASLTGMDLMTKLWLGSGLTGTIPDLTPIKDTLEVLSLQGPFTGKMDDAYLAIGASGNDVLQSLYVHSTKVAGPIPSLAGLTAIKSIYFASNREMHGGFPSLLGDTKLESLTLYWNLISGTVPPASFDTLDAMKYLQIARNSLIGTLPGFNAKARQTIERMRFHSNVLSEATVLSDSFVYPALKEIDGGANILSGTFPCHVQKYPVLYRVSLGENSLTGTIPCLDNLRGLEEILLHTNDFTGTIPATTASNGLTRLTLSHNRLSGTPFPQGFMDMLLVIKVFEMSGNQFGGTLPSVYRNLDLTHYRFAQNGPWVPLVATAVTAPAGFEAAVFDDNPATVWKGKEGQTVMYDFGSPVCVDTFTLRLGNDQRAVDASDARIRAVGTPTDLRIYQGNMDFTSGNTIQPMLRGTTWSPNTWSRSHPGHMHSLGKEVSYSRHFYDWQNYCRIPTRYYRVDITSCIDDNCVVAEMKLYKRDKISGTLPSFEGCTELMTLDVANNDLTGTIPDLSPNKWDDGSLLLHDNRFESLYNIDNGGTFCPFFQELKVLSLHHNNLKGTLPEWECMRKIEKIDVGMNAWSGTIPTLSAQTLTRLFIDGTACCVDNRYGYMTQYLTTNRRYYHSTAPRPCNRCTPGLTGLLPKWTLTPKLFLVDLDTASLSGPLGDVAPLANLETFSVRANRVAGTLPYREMIAQGNGKSSCYVARWWLSNNTFWGEVPDDPLPLATRNCRITTYQCRCGEVNHRNDGRKIYDILVDDNYMWGAIPSDGLARVQSTVQLRHNCWDCPLKTLASYGEADTCAQLGNADPCLRPVPSGGSATSSSPIPTWASGWAAPKKLSSPPNCKEGPAERYAGVGPSCQHQPPQAKGSLYEHVTRCAALPAMRYTIPEALWRTGAAGATVKVTFEDGSPLPFFAPGLFGCGDAPGPPKSPPWGPGVVNFTAALRGEIIASMTSDGAEPNGFARWRDAGLLTLGESLVLNATDPYVPLPNELLVKPMAGTPYDISRPETVRVTVPRAMFLAPFGEHGGGSELSFTIVPSPGMLTVPAEQLHVTEIVLRDVGVQIPLKLDYGETFACDTRDLNETFYDTCVSVVGAAGRVTLEWANATDEVRRRVQQTRTCDWRCGTKEADVFCEPGRLMAAIRIPDYELPEIATESIFIHIDSACVESGLPPQNGTGRYIEVVVRAEIEPTYTPTLTVTRDGTDSATFTHEVTKTVTQTITVTPTQTNVPFCVAFGGTGSLFCREGGGYGAPVLPVLVLMALCVSAGVLICGRLCRKKPPPPPRVRCSQQAVSVAVEESPDIVVTVRGGPGSRSSSDSATTALLESCHSAQITVTGRRFNLNQQLSQQ